jgi:hypothetical protein
MFKIIVSKSTKVQLCALQARPFSLWKKYVPKFMQNEKKDDKKSNIAVTPSDEIRQKILDAEVQEIIELGKKPQQDWIAKQSKRKKQQKKQQEKFNEDLAELRDEQVEELKVAPVFSIFEMMQNYEQNEDGSVKLPLFIENDQPKHFTSKQEYDEW